MRDFNRSNRPGGGRNFGRRSFGEDRDRQMSKVTCSNCGKECEVPFRPTGSRPVYCSDCFRDMGGLDARRTDDRVSRRPDFDNRDRSRVTAQPQYREQFDALNAKLDKILKILTPVTPEVEVPVVKEETTVKEAEVFKLEEQPVAPEKKKRSSKKVSLTPKE